MPNSTPLEPEARAAKVGENDSPSTKSFDVPAVLLYRTTSGTTDVPWFH